MPSRAATQQHGSGPADETSNRDADARNNILASYYGVDKRAIRGYFRRGFDRIDHAVRRTRGRPPKFSSRSQSAFVLPFYSHHLLGR
jgi:hypothetical protein